MTSNPAIMSSHRRRANTEGMGARMNGQMLDRAIKGLLRPGRVRRYSKSVKLSGRGSAWLERLVRDQEVGGSNPLAPTNLFKNRLYARNRHRPVQAGMRIDVEPGRPGE